MMAPLKFLPQADVFLRLLPAFAQAQILQSLIRRIFPAAALEQLLPLHGKRFQFQTPGRELCLLMFIDSRGVHVSHDGGDDADVIIRGDVAALTALCLGLEDTDSLFFSRRLLLTGDTSTGLLFKNVLANLDFDLRAELQRHMGRRAADALWRMAEQAINMVEHLDRRLDDGRQSIIRRLGLLSAEQGQVLEAEIHRIASGKADSAHRIDRRRRSAQGMAST